MPVLEELGALLAANGIGALGTTIFFNATPASPSDVVVLTEYGGAEGDLLVGQEDIDLEHPRVQVLSRAASAATGRAKAEAAYRVLRKVRNQVIGGTKYVAVTALQPPAFLQFDANNRAQFFFNVEAQKEPTV
jgi:hypothetical protein